MVPTLRWLGDVDGKLVIIDQTRLPAELVELEINDADALWEAIYSLRVRGAPAIGLAAAYGVVLGVRNHADRDEAALMARLRQVVAYLGESRPTAVNLFWALKRMIERA